MMKIFQRLSLMLLVSLVPLGASAQSPAADEIWYTTTNGNALVLASSSGIVSNTYADGKGILKFEEELSSVYAQLFLNCKKLKTVILPEGVTRIGAEAFSGCTSMCSITIPSEVTRIGSDAFNDCWLTASNTGITTASENISPYDYGLTEIDEEQEDGALISYNDKVGEKKTVVRCRPWATSVSLPANVIRISAEAFSDCSVLTSLELLSYPNVEQTAFKDANKNLSIRLALTDDSFLFTNSNPAFPVCSNISYSRTVSSLWGTVVLPFEVQSNSDVQLHQLTSVSDGVMTFEPVEIVSANTPCVFRKKNPNADKVTFTSSAYALSAFSPEAPEAIDGFAIRGTYVKKTDVTGVFFIAQDKFWNADAAITINPFRAFFMFDDSARGGNAKTFSISLDDDVTTQISRIHDEELRMFDRKYLENGKVVVRKNGKRYYANGTGTR